MPISIFCGLPVMVMALPIFDESISAIRKGIGLIFSERHMPIITGVKSNTTASFTRNALAIPVIIVSTSSSLKGVSATARVRVAIHPKNPSSSSVEIIIIMPSSRAMVLKSIACMASSKFRTPNTIIATAPKNAAEGRSIFIRGSRVKIMPV
jgi:hypothetical protein